MSRQHKMKTTRPEFLLSLMTGGDASALTMGNMKHHLCDTNHISYCVYTAIMAANIDQDEILATNDDGESIAITFRSKKMAKTVRDLCKDTVVRYGSTNYLVKLKVRDNHLIGEVKAVKDEDDD